jgi:2-polyprenyl-3-methyl-5-hydroxy-6-metoxy-1,4-benzoquinol methylase
MDPYEFNTEAYKESQWRPDDPRVKRILPLVGNNQTVLDLGCLDGTIGELLAKNGNTVYGIDASKSAIPRAVERGIKAELGNLEEPLRYDDKTFDVVSA